MSRASPVQLPRWQKRSLYMLFALLWLTGLLFWWAKTQWQISGDFGWQDSPWQARALLWHGVLVTPALVLMGSLLPLHWLLGWRRHIGRVAGVCLLVFMAVVVITGVMLWYASAPNWRELAGQVHWWLGLALPAAVAGHILLARRSLRS
ncbi:MAG: DUF4405 domain-containing protein [Paraperlucidibaca sp.]